MLIQLFNASLDAQYRPKILYVAGHGIQYWPAQFIQAAAQRTVSIAP